MSGCTAAARCCVLRPGLEVSSASSPRTLASCRAFTSRFITSAFCGQNQRTQKVHGALPNIERPLTLASQWAFIDHSIASAFAA